VVKVLTIYGTLALPLVVITGFFGMNLHLPWSDNPYGVWFASGLMALSIVVVLAYFKRKQWFWKDVDEYAPGEAGPPSASKCVLKRESGA